MSYPARAEGLGKYDNLCILNDNSPTYLKPSTDSYSAIDITLSELSSCMDYIWKVYDDLCGSDHSPIILETTQPIHDNNIPPSWKINKRGKWLYSCSFVGCFFQDLLNTLCRIGYLWINFCEHVYKDFLHNRSLGKTVFLFYWSSLTSIWLIAYR